MKSNHTHQLRRHHYKTTGSAIFFCTQPDCNYKVDVSLSLGKATLCNKCGNETRIDEYSIRSARPLCKLCRKRRSDANLVDKRVIARRKNDPLPESVLASEIVDDLQDRLKAVTRVYEPEDDDVEL